MAASGGAIYARLLEGQSRVPRIGRQRSKPTDPGTNGTTLIDLGWQVLELWECKIRDVQQIEERLLAFLHASPGLPGPPS